MKYLEFALDTLHAAFLYRSGITEPRVARGYFSDDEKGRYQHLFFDELLAQGFQRTPFQLIFPNQTAGLIRKIKPTQDGMDEIHVRFYSDGVIAAELEYGRFSMDHWRNKRESSVSVLEEILDTEMPHLSSSVSSGIRNQFCHRDYIEHVLPAKSTLSAHPFSRYLQHLGITAFLTVQTPLSFLGASYYFSKGEIYHGLEPALFVLLVDVPFLAIAYSSLGYKTYTRAIDHKSI